MIERKPFGRTKDGRAVTAFSLVGKGGLRLEALDWGCRVNRIVYPDGTDVILGFDSPAGWEDGDPYYGVVVGRYANRIANGQFALDGKTYRLACNNFPANVGCALHGSDGGWHAAVWSAEPFETEGDVGLVFTRVSPDGEGGFPGEMKVKVTYTLTPANVWRIEYEATTDRPTPIAMTQHVYFNFKGEAKGSVEDHLLGVEASAFYPYAASQIPTGEVRAVAGTAFDFRLPRAIGARIGDDDEQLAFGKGYDHCWRVDGAGFRKAASLAAAGKSLAVFTDAPAIQIYTGNWIPARWPAKGGETLSPRCGVALETGAVPDSPNHPEFPNVILRPGETYRSATEYRFGGV